MYYGYRCYNKDGKDEGWLYTAQAERELNPTKNPDFFHWCKRWKTERGARKNFDHYNSRWQSYTKGGYLKIEVMPEMKIEQNTDNIKESQSKEDENIYVWNLEFKEGDEDILEWLNEQRLDDESNQELVVRKLRKLMNLEQQRY